MKVFQGGIGLSAFLYICCVYTFNIFKGASPFPASMWVVNLVISSKMSIVFEISRVTLSTTMHHPLVLYIRFTLSSRLPPHR